jgi:hypothetical protein
MINSSPHPASDLHLSAGYGSANRRSVLLGVAALAGMAAVVVWALSLLVS